MPSILLFSKQELLRLPCLSVSMCIWTIRGHKHDFLRIFRFQSHGYGCIYRSDKDNCHHPKIPEHKPADWMRLEVIHLWKLRIWEIVWKDYLVTWGLVCKEDIDIYLLKHFHFLLEEILTHCNPILTSLRSCD